MSSAALPVAVAVGSPDASPASVPVATMSRVMPICR